MNTDKHRFWIYLIVVVLCRAADLGTTFLVTPDLRWEINPLIRRMGWGGTILFNVIVCFIATDLAVLHGWPLFAQVLCGMSVLAGRWNVWIFRTKIDKKGK